MKARLLALILPAIPLVTATAQEAKPRPAFRAVRAQLAPVVDADLSDPVWQNAPEMTGFTQRDPNEGQPATQQTKIKAAYTNEAIYFAAVMEDEQPGTPLLARRDSDLNTGDYIRISIDSQYDRQNGAAFVVNASNVQMDMILYNDIYDDITWDAVWDSAAKITSNGWVAEVRIPYSQLRFPARPVHTWGLNVSRWNTRIRESSRLVHSPKTETGFVSRFGDLEGIEGVAPKRGFELLPYAVARTDVFSRNTNPFIEATAHQADAGLDLKYGITSTLTLTGTINPDFGQVEVDPAVLNLSQFETSFTEKRPFFTEGASIFRFGNGPASSRWTFNSYSPTIFYSRRIGRAPQGVIDAQHVESPGETTILGAAKVTGKVGNGWTVGILDAVTDREEGWFQLRTGEVGTRSVEPMTNYLTARATKEYGADSRAGLMFTSVNRRLDDHLDNALREDAYFGGVDGYTRFDDRSWIFEWQAGSSLVQGSEAAIARTQLSSARYFDRPDASHVEFDPTRTSLTGWMSRAMLGKQTGRWRPNVQLQLLSPGLEINDLGMLPRTDAIASHAVLQYLNTDATKYTREISWWVGKYQNWNFDSDLLANGFAGNGFVQLKNYWQAWMWGGLNLDRFSDQNTRGGPVMAIPESHYIGGGFGTDNRQRFSASLEGEAARSGWGGNSSSFWLSLTYRPTPALRISLAPTFRDIREGAQYVTWQKDDAATETYGKRYIFATLDQRTLDVGIRTDWTMNARLSMQLYLQPFVGSGDYHDYKYLTRARDDEFTPTAEGDDDFNFRSVRGSAVVRWEFRPGSAMYVVWNENRAETVGFGDFRPRRDFGALPNAPSRDVFLVKFSYWLPM